MNPYEEILRLMKQQGEKNKVASIQVGIMESDIVCQIGELRLSGGDLLIAEHLKTGYHCSVDNDQPSRQDESTFIGKLKKGDRVAVYRMSDELYIILERLVSL